MAPQPETSDPGEAELPADADIFRLHYSIGILYLALHAVTHVVNHNTASRVDGHRKQVGDTVQKGFSYCQCRSFLRFMTLVGIFWLQFVMMDVAECKYHGIWSSPPPHGPLTWDSYTRAFLAPWCTSLALALACHLCLRRTLVTHYLRPVPLRDATYVCVEEQDGEDRRSGSESRCTLHEVLDTTPTCFEHQLRRYTFDGSVGAFALPAPWIEFRGHVLREALLSLTSPSIEPGHGAEERSAAHQEWRQQQYTQHGPNAIDVKVPALWHAFAAECMSLFHLYQYFAVWLMFYWDYITVALLTGLLALSALVVKVSSERATLVALQILARLEAPVLLLKSDGSWYKTSSRDLVPGDVVLFGGRAFMKAGGAVPCDLAIVSGNCVVDEAQLTGEAMPVAKVAMPDDDRARPNDRAEFKKHYLFAGTRLVQASGYTVQENIDMEAEVGVAGVVIATAGSSVRGQLLQSLLYGQRTPLPLERDVPKILGVLLFLGLIGFLALGFRWGFALGPCLSAIFLVIGLVNPLLSVAAIGGQLASSKRLKQSSEVSCRNIQRLAASGAVEVMLFDKTGTLTEQGLDLVGFLPPAAASVALTDLSVLGMESAGSSVVGLQKICALAHSVKSIRPSTGPTRQGAAPAAELIGHELELQMVRAAQRFGWQVDWSQQPSITAHHAAHGTMKVVKSFEFDHELMMMSAVVEEEATGDLYVFSKGSAESIKARSRRNLPALELASERLARTGCYVISCASRQLKTGLELTGMSRADFERDLDPAGALVFRNELKVDTSQHLATLLAGGITVRMVTGDHALTAISVSRLAGIVPDMHEVWLGELDIHGGLVWRSVDSGIELRSLRDIPRPATLAVLGTAFGLLQSVHADDLPSLLDTCCDDESLTIRVFARTAPAHKIAVVECHQALGHIVGFCGDGGNDSGALRAAHTGLALSGRAEASMAAPCCTPRESLGTLVALLGEGRSSLCTSIAACRFLVITGLIRSFGTMFLLFGCGGYLAPLAYLYIGLIVSPYFLWAITQTLPRQSGLAPYRPECSLVSCRALMAPVLCVLVDFSFYYFTMSLLFDQPFFVPFDSGKVPLHAWQVRADSYESAVAMLWISWCVVDVALVVSYGTVHRVPLAGNFNVVAGAIVFHTLHVVLLFSSDTRLGCSFKINCTAKKYAELENSYLNILLFEYERLGGDFYAPNGSNLLSFQFKCEMLTLLILSSLANHGVYRLVEGLPPAPGSRHGKTAPGWVGQPESASTAASTEQRRSGFLGRLRRGGIAQGARGFAHFDDEGSSDEEFGEGDVQANREASAAPGTLAQLGVTPGAQLYGRSAQEGAERSRSTAGVCGAEASESVSGELCPPMFSSHSGHRHDGAISGPPAG